MSETHNPQRILMRNYAPEMERHAPHLLGDVQAFNRATIVFDETASGEWVCVKNRYGPADEVVHMGIEEIERVPVERQHVPGNVMPAGRGAEVHRDVKPSPPGSPLCGAE